MRYAWRFADHGHQYRAIGTGYKCKRCEWFMSLEEKKFGLYEQLHWDCYSTQNFHDGLGPGELQQCKYAQILLFQDGEDGGRVE